MRFIHVHPLLWQSILIALLLRASQLDGDELRTCTPEDDARWEWLRQAWHLEDEEAKGDKRLLVEIDDSGDETRFVGPIDRHVIPATDGIHKWIPKDTVKQTVCGTLDHVGFFHNVTAEYDWDNYIKPFDRWRTLADHPAAEPCEQDPKTPCMSAEVTPPPDLRRKNAWWKWETHSCKLVNSPVCVYGPWVGDDGHGNRPEIHPAQAIWFQAGDGTSNILLIQDASARFEHLNQFERSTHAPSWNPWVPRKWDARFRVWFELPANTLPIFNIAASGHDRQSDPNDPNVHEWPPNGHAILQWRRSGPSWRTVEIEPFRERVGPAEGGNLLCRTKIGAIRGYFVLRARLYSPFCETCAAEGFNLIQISQGDKPPQPFGTDPLPGLRTAHFLIEERALDARHVPATSEKKNELDVPGCLAAPGFVPPDLQEVNKWRLTVRAASAEDDVRDLQVTWHAAAQEGSPSGVPARVSLSTSKGAGGIEGAQVDVTIEGSCDTCDYLIEATITNRDPQQEIEVRDSRGNTLEGNTLLWHLSRLGMAVNEPPEGAQGNRPLDCLAALAAENPPDKDKLEKALDRAERETRQDEYGARRARQAVVSAAADGVLSREDVRSLVCEIKQYFRSARFDFSSSCFDHGTVTTELTARRRVGLLRSADWGQCCTAQHIGLNDTLSTR